MGNWVLTLLGTAYLNSDSILLSIIAWASSILAVATWITSTWGLSRMEDIAKRHWAKILKLARPISIGMLFICFIFAAFSMQTKQASDLSNANKRINDLEFDQAMATQALKQQSSFPIPDTPSLTTATATVDIFVKSNEDIQTQDLGSGGYMALANKDNIVLLLMSDTNDHRNQLGNGTVRYRGVFNMDATSVFAKNTIGVVKQADYAQIGFITIPKGTEILASEATVVINSNIKFDIPIPPQTVTDLTVNGIQAAIFVRNIEPYLTK